MKFEDAIKEVVDGKEVERSDGGSDLVIMYLSDNEIQFKSQSGIILGQAVTRPDLTADWCVVEEKKPTLSDMVKNIEGIEMYYEYNILESVTEIKSALNNNCFSKGDKVSSIIETIEGIIDSKLGGRFK